MTKYTYIGRRVPSGKSKSVHAFYETTDGIEPTSFTFFPKAKAVYFAGVEIGGIYDLGDLKGLPQNWRKYKIDMMNDEYRDKWEGMDREAIMQIEGMRVDPTPRLTDAIKTLRRAKAQFPIQKKTMFDAWLLQQLR